MDFGFQLQIAGLQVDLQATGMHEVATKRKRDRIAGLGVLPGGVERQARGA